MKFKILSLVTAMFMASCILGLTACTSDKENTDFHFAVNDAGYEVTGLVDSSVTDIVIPSSYNKKPVVAIAERAFAESSGLVSVTIPDAVKTIGANAFADCVKLESVSFGSGIKEIGKAAFARCEELIKVNIPDIGAWCGVTFDSASSNPLYFAHNLFLNNVAVTEVNVPAAVTKISDFAFYECGNLVKLNTGSGVKTIGEMAFFKCAALESVTVSASSIGELAFSQCGELKELNLGARLKTIGEYAFSECVSLSEATFPSSVEDIGESAFAVCTGLKNVFLNDGLEAIGDGAFSGCSSLEKFLMPDSVTSLGMGVLMMGEGGGFVEPTGEVGGVSEISISNSVTEIPDFAFSKCGITSIEIPGKVERISYSSFYGCAKLESIVIPKSVERIISYAFSGCPMLRTVYYAGTAAEWVQVKVGKSGNTVLSEAKICFYSASKPSAGGNYWRYVNGIPTLW